MLMTVLAGVLVAATATDQGPRVYFAQMAIRGAVTRDSADLLLDLLAREAATRGVQAVTYKEVEGAMDQERLRSAISGGRGAPALDARSLANADELLVATLEGVGQEVSLTASRVRVKDSSVVARASIRSHSTEGAAVLLDRIPEIALRLFGPAPGAPVRRPRLVVLPLSAGAGVDRALLDVATNILAARLARRADMDLVTLQEIQALVSPEQMDRARACDGEACAAEIAGALDAREIVVGNVGKVGESILVTASRIQAKDAHVIQRASLRLDQPTEGIVLDSMAGVAEQLVPGAPEPERQAAAPVVTGEPGPGIGTRVLGAAAVGSGTVGALLMVTALAAAALNLSVVGIDAASGGRPGLRNVTPTVAMAGNAAWAAMLAAGAGGLIFLGVTAATTAAALVL